MLFYIDGNNVGNWSVKGQKHISQDIIFTLLVTLKRLGHDYVCYFDATVHNQIGKDQKELNYIRCLFRYDENTKQEKYRIVPTKSRADEFILPEADNDNASVISNDKFEPYENDFPFVKKDVVPQRLFRGKVQNSVKGKMLIVTNLINVPLETDIPKLLIELGVDIRKYRPSAPKPPNDDTNYKSKSKPDNPRPSQNASKSNEKIEEKQFNEFQHNVPENKDEDIKNWDKSETSNQKGKSTGEVDGPTEKKEDYSSLLIILGILAIVILFFKFNSSNSNSSSKDLVVHETPAQAESNVSISEVKDCENNNTGSAVFINNSSQVVYITIIQLYLVQERFVVSPKNKYTLDLKADEFTYLGSYYQSDDFTRYDVRGDFEISQCKHTKITIDVPNLDWYFLLPDVWKEVTFPDDGDYFIAAPGEGFKARYSGEQDINYYHTYYTQRAKKGDKMYFSTNKDGGTKISVEKVTRGSTDRVSETPNSRNSPVEYIESPSSSELYSGEKKPTFAKGTTIYEYQIDGEKGKSIFHGSIGNDEVKFLIPVTDNAKAEIWCIFKKDSALTYIMKGRQMRDGGFKVKGEINGKMTHWEIHHVNRCYEGTLRFEDKTTLPVKMCNRIAE